MAKIRDEAHELRNRPVEEDTGPPTTDDSVRSAVETDNPIPTPPFWGAREIDIDLDEVFPYLDRHVLFKLHWGGRGKKGEEWRQIVEGYDGDEGFAPKLERMWREQDYLNPTGPARLLPLQLRRQRAGDLRPRRPRPRDRAARLPAPAAPRPHLPRRLLPSARQRRDADVVALQAVTVGPEVTERITELEREGEFAEQLFTHGLGVQAAEGLAEWLHAEVRRELGIDPDQGRRYSWGYPACPDQSEHEKVERLLGMSEIGISLSGGYALEPEQSTAAIIAHHPQAVYFGMKSGFVPAEKKGDELIAGTDRGGELPPEVEVEGDGTIEAEADEPSMEAASA